MQHKQMVLFHQVRLCSGFVVNRLVSPYKSTNILPEHRHCGRLWVFNALFLPATMDFLGVRTVILLLEFHLDLLPHLRPARAPARDAMQFILQTLLYMCETTHQTIHPARACAMDK